MWFFEFINEFGVEFVCLKQQYDTTSPQGRLFVTIMIALAQFEREQTADRTRDATHARAERGLWNGGQLLGYDLDPNRKGYLIPNESETALVNFAFTSYLQTGSIAETRDALNQAGYRTKAYTSRRGQVHPGAEFNFTSMQYLLKNPAYVGQKELEKKASAGKPRRTVDAVWPPIIDESLFNEAQSMLSANGRTGHNGAAPVRHTYALSPGLLFCGRCETAMEGRSGTGRLGTKYFYYVCRNGECGLRVSTDEIEAAVLNRLAVLAGDAALLERLTNETNVKLQSTGPALARQRTELQKRLSDVEVEADKVLGQWGALKGQDGRAFLTERLNALAQKRADLEHGLAAVEEELRRSKGECVSAAIVADSLTNFTGVYACLKPYEQRELMHLVLARAEVGDHQIVLEINGDVPAVLAGTSEKSASRFEPPVWLPGLDSNQRHGG